MDTIIEFLIYYLLSYPGALIRSFFVKKSFKDLLDESITFNAGVSILLAVIVLLAYYFFN
ncbi:hypothetical protein D3C87_1454630 [compost metagenome]|uniref:Uncharacterized protein n=1 Tax=Solitalea canadensis (strain ATCC 29591 / DSM 3403 / JCM 21819 / LMG 8368 / NBRC 15130 / NCIMB 12057 / USAM 9D) TaxID=929556 RepID=H8KVN6_SOLCM|nr:hypothetical protein [Solitalea canadensis]AFD06539.1 hypothetical protein Solca_1459 [Solitalea canadensis DSM 3403]